MCGWKHTHRDTAERDTAERADGRRCCQLLSSAQKGPTGPESMACLLSSAQKGLTGPESGVSSEDGAERSRMAKSVMSSQIGAERSKMAESACQSAQLKEVCRESTCQSTCQLPQVSAGCKCTAEDFGKSVTTPKTNVLVGVPTFKSSEV